MCIYCEYCIHVQSILFIYFVYMCSIYCIYCIHVQCVLCLICVQCRVQSCRAKLGLTLLDKCCQGLVRIINGGSIDKMPLSPKNLGQSHTLLHHYYSKSFEVWYWDFPFITSDNIIRSDVYQQPCVCSADAICAIHISVEPRVDFKFDELGRYYHHRVPAGKR